MPLINTLYYWFALATLPVYSQCVSEINKQNPFRAASKWKKTQLTEDHDYAAKYDWHLDDKRAIETFNYNPPIYQKYPIQFNGLYLRTTSMQSVLNNSTAALYPLNLSTSKTYHNPITTEQFLMRFFIFQWLGQCRFASTQIVWGLGLIGLPLKKWFLALNFVKENWYKKPFKLSILHVKYNYRFI